jgi:hypothetical protein
MRVAGNAIAASLGARGGPDGRCAPACDAVGSPLVKWIVIFFIFGVLFGLAADKYAWVFLIVPVFFIGLAWFLEGFSAYALIVGLLAVAATGGGIIVGHLLVFRRTEPHESVS